MSSAITHSMVDVVVSMEATIISYYDMGILFNYLPLGEKNNDNKQQEINDENKEYKFA